MLEVVLSLDPRDQLWNRAIALCQRRSLTKQNAVTKEDGYHVQNDRCSGRVYERGSRPRPVRWLRLPAPAVRGLATNDGSRDSARSWADDRLLFRPGRPAVWRVPATVLHSPTPASHLWRTAVRRGAVWRLGQQLRRPERRQPRLPAGLRLPLAPARAGATGRARSCCARRRPTRR